VLAIAVMTVLAQSEAAPVGALWANALGVSSGRLVTYQNNVNDIAVASNMRPRCCQTPAAVRTRTRRTRYDLLTFWDMAFILSMKPKHENALNRR
jgi:hypothetical protein